MARFRFDPRAEYPARLHAVWRKPIENKQVQLLRLEFEVFKPLFSDPNRLTFTGKMACRDIVIGDRLDAGVDSGIMPFISALNVKSPFDKPESWLSLANTHRWVIIKFGPSDKKDFRNPFLSIGKFQPDDRTIDENPDDLSKELVTVGQAARQLRTSENTIRRIVKRFEAEYGGELVHRTKGNQRRINLRLLRNLV